MAKCVKRNGPDAEADARSMDRLCEAFVEPLPARHGGRCSNGDQEVLYASYGN
jgi:hypothetical protein